MLEPATHEPRAAGSRVPAAWLWALGGVVLAGALLRFATLGDQSLWYDEGLTRDLVLRPFFDMVDAVADTENTPPLSYILTKLSTDVLGADEVGLRLVSALAGTATIVVAFFGGRELSGPRAGLIAGGLVAANPLLFWFSQEARSYALLSLFTAIAFVCFLRALSAPGRLVLAGWALSSAAAVVTHYFAIFPAIAEAGWLAATLWRSPARRGALAAIGAAALAAVAIAPMAIAQQASGRAETITEEGLGQRIAQVPKQFLVGYDGPAQSALAVLSAVLLAIAAAGLWRARSRPQVLAAAAVVVAAILVPIAAAVAGADFLNTRNVIPGLVPALVLAGAGFALLPQPWGAAGAVALMAAGVATIVGVSTTAAYQRADWRSIDRAIGESGEQRLLVASPAGADVPLRAYRHGIAPAPERELRVREVLLAGAAAKTVAGGDAAPPRTEPPALPGFTLAERELADTYTLYRYTAARPVAVTAAALAPAGLTGDSSVVLVPAGSR